MSLDSERRRFRRYALESAVAIDEGGRELGEVVEVGGGGVGVKLNADRRLDEWPQGRKIRVTVVEPRSEEHTMMFRVCYMREGVLGLEFAGD
jgi:PilZ domain